LPYYKSQAQLVPQFKHLLTKQSSQISSLHIWFGVIIWGLSQHPKEEHGQSYLDISQSHSIRKHSWHPWFISYFFIIYHLILILAKIYLSLQKRII
jgi:hypothetical protein